MYNPTLSVADLQGNVNIPVLQMGSLRLGHVNYQGHLDFGRAAVWTIVCLLVSNLFSTCGLWRWQVSEGVTLFAALGYPGVFEG